MAVRSATAGIRKALSTSRDGPSRSPTHGAVAVPTNDPHLVAAQHGSSVTRTLGSDRVLYVPVIGQDGTTVQIMIERPDGSVTIEDCTQVSRRLSPVFDAYDPMPGGYNLEVSSPGIDRSLVRPRDFVAWTGHQARVELKELVDGRRRFKGRIEGFEDGEVLLKVELDEYDQPQTIGLAVDLIDEAKLTVNDTSIKAALKKKPAQ